MRRMQLISILTFMCLLLFSNAFSSSVVIVPPANNHESVNKKLSTILSFRIRDFEKVTGRKLTLKEKIEFNILKLIAKKKVKGAATHKDKTDQGKLALILGIIGLVALFIPYVGLIALPCAIIALVLGYSARRKDFDNKKAKTAIILGWVTIGLFIVALIVVLAILAAFAWY